MLLAYASMMKAKTKLCERAKEFAKEEKGAAEFIAVILIIAIIVALVVIFKDNISALFEKIWGQISSDADSAISVSVASTP